jgi:hypothetical protein
LEIWHAFLLLQGQNVLLFVVHKKFKLPYIGMVDGQLIDHPELMQEKRARMKIMLFDPSEDIPVEDMDNILNQAIKLRR